MQRRNSKPSGATPKDGAMDDDTREILEEMEAEGIDTSSLTGGEKIISNGGTDAPDEDDDAPDEDDDAPDEDDDAPDEDDDNDEDDEPIEAMHPTQKLTLVDKYRHEKKLRKEAQDALSKLQASKSEETFDLELENFAKKAGMDLDIAKQLINFAARAKGREDGLSAEEIQDLRAIRKEKQKSEIWSAQHKQFDQDFENNVRPVLLSMGKDEEEIKDVYDTLNTNPKSGVWAWDPKNAKVSLVKLALQATKGSKTRISSESSDARSFNRGKTNKSYTEDATAEEIENMSDEEFDKYSDAKGKQSKGAIHRS